MNIDGQGGGHGRAPQAVNRAIMYTFKKSYRTFFPGVALLALLLAGSPCYSQSGPVEDPAPNASASSDELFARVIANQKRVDADLNIYERVERVEIRKTGSDPKPSEVKMWRVFPAGTGMMQSALRRKKSSSCVLRGCSIMIAYGDLAARGYLPRALRPT